MKKETKELICPLLAIKEGINPEDGSGYCRKEECAWWTVYYNGAGKQIINEECILCSLSLLADM